MSESRSTEPLSNRSGLSDSSGFSAYDKLRLQARVSLRKPEPTLNQRLQALYDESLRRVQINELNLGVLKDKVFLQSGQRTTRGLNGIIDTGADVSVIPSVLVDAWKLTSCGTMNARVADGRTTSMPCYEIWLQIPDVPPRKLRLPAADRDSVLLGRDIFKNCRVTFDFANDYVSVYECSWFRRFYGKLMYIAHRVRDRLVHRSNSR